MKMSNFERKLEELRKEVDELLRVAVANKATYKQDNHDWHYFSGRLDAYWHVLNIIKKMQERGE